MTMRTATLISVLTCSLMLHTGESLAQGYSGAAAASEPIAIVDKPTAGMLKRASYQVTSNYFQQGGLLVGISVGVFDQFMFGISYGGTDIIGKNAIRMNPTPGVQAKLRLFNEGDVLPAIAIGFDSQGKEPYLSGDSLQRYTIKAPGAYVTASRNYAFLGNLSIHGGLNFSTERKDGDKDMNTFLGLEKSIGDDISLLAEYDFAFNDNHGRAVGRGRGYLNLAFRWNWGKGLVVGFDLKNVTKNQQNVSVGNRLLQIDFVGSL
jgi:hypothetical protein